eukprot:4992032-Prymnesium_polylepis.1
MGCVSLTSLLHAEQVCLEWNPQLYIRETIDKVRHATITNELHHIDSPYHHSSSAAIVNCCMNGSFNIRTRQGGSGRVVHGAADRRYDVKGCRITCTRGTGMRRAQALAAI